MSLYLNGTVDPIAAASGRELNYIPKHFRCVTILPNIYDFKPIRNWIWKNQSGRFCISTRIKFQNNSMVSENVVAFEDEGEAIMFSFIQPTLKSESEELF